MWNGNDESNPARISGFGGDVFRVITEEGKVEYVPPQKLTQQQLNELPMYEREIATDLRKEARIWDRDEIPETRGEIPDTLPKETTEAKIPPIFTEVERGTEKPPIFNSESADRAFPTSQRVFSETVDELEWNRCFGIVANLMNANSPNALSDLGFNISLTEDQAGTGIEMTGPDDIKISFNPEGKCIHNLSGDLDRLYDATNDLPEQSRSLNLSELG